MALAEFNAAASLAGGALIGVSAALLFWTNGRIAGISSIFSGALFSDRNRAWTATFLGGLLVGGLVLQLVHPAAYGGSIQGSLPMVLLAGALVGAGTRLGAGCTSGHGICGMARFSTRSYVAAATFIGAGMVTVAVVRAVGGAA